MATSIDFYFDYTCPYAYLASTQIERVARESGRAFVYKPILLGGVFRAIGTAQNLVATLAPAKAAHNGADMMRWAKKYGVPLVMPPGHPRRSVEALRATIATGVDPKMIHGFFRAYWVDGLEISAPETIASIASAAGHDPTKLREAIGTAAVKQDLALRTDEAVKRGVFGVPTFYVDGELTWGQDRMDHVFGIVDKRSPKRVPRPRTLDVYFDFSSPFAYLGATQIDALAARTGATVRWRPVLLGGLFKAIGQVDLPLSSFPAGKQKFVFDDLHRCAKRLGVPFAMPSTFPTRSLDALRLYLALPGDKRDAYRAAVFRAFWGEDKDITRHDVLAACGADADAFAKMTSDAVKSELRASTEQAMAAGVFGVPTFIVDERALFWGQDRLGLVEDALVEDV